MKEDAEVRAAQAEAAHAAGDVAGEAAALERLAQLQPSPGQWRRIGELRLQTGDLAGAERAFVRAVEGDPRDVQAQLGLGRVWVARGQPDPAVRALRAAGAAGQADLAVLSARLNLGKVQKNDHGAVQLAVQQLVQRTYKARVAQVPSLRGTLRLRVSIDAAGEANNVEVLEDSVHDADVLACASWNLRDAAYPPDQPGRYTFTFQLRR
ncbi:MAG: tetratricopeptide repeat protein [Anaeromyxobacter sp.]